MPNNYFLRFSAAAMLALTLGTTSSLNATVTTAASIYVIQNDPTIGSSSLLQISTNERGSVTPTTLVTMPTDTTFDAVATDSIGNVYVSATVMGSTTTNEILVYSVSSTGTATLARTLTNMTSVATSMAVDSIGQIYALSGNSIGVFAAGANGGAAPVRLISGASTLLNTASAITVDRTGDVYVANTLGGNVLVFNSSATGNVAPTRLIAGTTTGITQPWGVAVDAVGNLFVTSSSKPAPASVAQILEFAATANGDVAPIKSLDVASPTVAAGIAVDATGKIHTLLANADTLELSVGVYAMGASGTTAPAQTITASAWTSTKDAQIAIR